MLDRLTRQPDDPLLALTALFRSDPTPQKIDLGVGVYRDSEGKTPVFRAVKKAEARLVDLQQSKAYVGPEDDTGFISAFWNLVAGPHREAAGVQTVGGTDALRLAGELLRRSGCRRILLGLPSWPNHAAIFESAGLEVVSYPFFDATSLQILEEPMLQAFARSKAGDAVLLHACCHNPTGAVISDDLWNRITDMIAERELLPLIDNAYQGFGQGINKDAEATCRLIDRVPEAIIAASASKSFGLYRERTGAVFVTAATAEARDKAKSHIVNIVRASYSCRPITVRPWCVPSSVIPGFRKSGSRSLRVPVYASQPCGRFCRKDLPVARTHSAPLPDNRACFRVFPWTSGKSWRFGHDTASTCHCPGASILPVSIFIRCRG